MVVVVVVVVELHCPHNGLPRVGGHLCSDVASRTRPMFSSATRGWSRNTRCDKPTTQAHKGRRIFVWQLTSWARFRQ